ncbi:hypothetical protein MCEZEM1_02748 [Comamonadaceae bacterium]
MVSQSDSDGGDGGLAESDGIAGGGLTLGDGGWTGEGDGDRVLWAGGAGAAGSHIIIDGGGDRAGSGIGGDCLKAATGDGAQAHDDGLAVIGQSVIEGGEVEGGRSGACGDSHIDHTGVVGAIGGGAGVCQSDSDGGDGGLAESDGIAGGGLTLGDGGWTGEGDGDRVLWAGGAGAAQV